MTLFEDLIANFKQATGLPLELDAKDSCALETDGLIIVLQYRREQDDMVIFAPVTDPDQIAELSTEVLTTALALSYQGEGTGGNFLGLFEDSLILSRSVSLAGLDAEKLAELVLSFSEQAIYVRDMLLASAKFAQTTLAAGEQDTDLSVLSEHNVLSV